MHFYEVLPSSNQFHGKEPLTYSFAAKLSIGAVVVVPLRSQSVVAAVVKEVSKPKFATKAISKQVLPQAIPAQVLSLVTWLHGYYPAPLGSLGQLILPSSLLRKRELASVEAATVSQTASPMPALTTEQQAAVKQINQAPKRNSFILHGDTGTGKTRIYLELALQSLSSGKSVLLLTPEIGLTPQLEKRVRSSLSAPVVVVHSHLTPAERRRVWLQVIQATQPIVVIGPRSAMFTPLSNLGLIVIDEAHDQAYKQEQAPHYQTSRVAAQLAKLHRALLIQGTATPNIADYAMATASDVPVIRLTDHPAGSQTQKHIITVNLRDRDQFPSQPHLSQVLLEQIGLALANHQQSLVFLNRRGTARLILCQNCGWQALCPNCDLPLTYHGDSHQLRCHTCGHIEGVPSSCPVCASTDIMFKNIGTKALAEELARVFPEARIKRFDNDSLKADRLEQQYADVEAGKVDVLVGTQILAKGLDLPNLTVVGVAVADTSLYFPDFTADEQTFQLLTQVMGRVGRGHKRGTIVIQSYSPESPVIRSVVAQDWQQFYQEQLDERQKYRFPPFCHLLKLSCVRSSQRGASSSAEKLVQRLKQSGLAVQIIGPAPSFYEKIASKYRWQVIIKAKDRRDLLKIIADLPSGWTFDIDPSNLL